MKRIPCEVFTRVVGYYRPVAQFNKGKKEEYKDRVYVNTDEKQLEEKSKC